VGNYPYPPADNAPSVMPAMESIAIPASQFSFFFNLFHMPDRFNELPLYQRWFIHAFLPVLFIFSVCFFQYLTMADFPDVRENIPSAELKKIIQLLYPLPHIHGFTIQRLKFRKLQIHVDDPVQYINWRKRVSTCDLILYPTEIMTSKL